MKKFAFTLVLLAMAAFSYAATVNTTVGTYDENSIAANQVDLEATTDTANQVSLATHAAAVLDAYNGNYGGVWQAEGDDLKTTDPVSIFIGKDDLYSVVLAPAAGVEFQFDNTPGNGRTPISGTAAMKANSYTPGYTFGAISDVAGGTELSGVGVIQMGFTVLPRNGSATVLTVEATFSGGGSESVMQSFTSADGNTEDTFFGFQAPDGEFITGFAVTGNSTNQYYAWDDLGVVTSVPEPATMSLLGLGGLLALRRRRSR